MSAGAVSAIAALAAEHADRSERERRLAPEVVDALRAADLFRLCVPRELGGAEAAPLELIEAVETLARADASTGWCLAVTATSGLVAAYLDEEAAREIYGSAGVAVGGVFAPRGHAVGAGDRLEVTGRWAFASGSPFCDWLMGGCLTELDGRPVEPRLVLFPRDDVEIVDTWTVSGLCGDRQPRHRRGRPVSAGVALGRGDRRVAASGGGAVRLPPVRAAGGGHRRR